MTPQEDKSLKKEKKIEQTWFWKYIVDNKFVSILLIIFLLLLTIFIFTLISDIFSPLQAVLNILGPMLIFSGLFYYLFVPIVNFFEKKGVNRKGAIWIVYGGITLLLGLNITFIIPGLRDQFNQLVEDFPRIWSTAVSQVEALLYDEWLTEVYQELQATEIFSRLTQQITNLFSVTVGSISNVAGLVTRLIVTIFTIPFILYYLLADSSHFKKAVLKITPTRSRPTVNKFIYLANEQVGAYVRGQLSVAFAVAIIFYIGYRIIGLEYALILSILAGVLNLIPYLGSILAAVPALIIGVFVSPLQLLKVILVIVVEQTIEGRVVSPLILGNELDIHPLVILFIMLVSGSLFGFMGLILAVPGFAVLRVVWNLFFDWLKESYDFYEEEEEIVKNEE